MRNAAFGTGCRGWAGTIGAGGGGGGAGSASREAFGAALLFGRSNDLGFTGGAALLFGRSSDLGSTVGGFFLLTPLSFFTGLLVLSLSFSRHRPRTGLRGGGSLPGSGREGPYKSSSSSAVISGTTKPFFISSSMAARSSLNFWFMSFRFCNCFAFLSTFFAIGVLFFATGLDASAINFAILSCMALAYAFSCGSLVAVDGSVAD